MAITANAALLEECRDLFRDHLLEAVATTFDGMEVTLMALAEKATDVRARERYLEARGLARQNRDVIAARFRARLMEEFQDRIERSRQVVEAASFDLDAMELVGDDEMSETLSFNGMANKLRWFCEEEMGALDRRVAVLLGRPTLDADDNPFGARVVADAFKHACHQLDCPLDVRLVFLRSFEQLGMDGIRSTCREVNDILVANAILPKIRYGSPRKDGKRAPVQVRRDEELAAAAAPPPDMFAALAQILFHAPGHGGTGGGAPSAGVGVGGAPLVQGAQLMGSLTSMQRGDFGVLGAAAAEVAPILARAGEMQNVLEQLKGTSVGASMGQMDAMTLEIVSLLFDELFEDPKIPLALKGLIGRLQLPMLKVAIADKDLFSSKSHPARRLLDTLGQIGVRLPQDFGGMSPLFPRLEAFVEELVARFQEDTEVFDEVRNLLEGLIAQEDARVADEMRWTQREMEQGEALSLAKSESQAEIRVRLQASRQTPYSVAEFLAHQWVKYMVVVRAREGREGLAWRDACATVDLLLWSVEPKHLPEDRRGLMNVIPGLLRALKAGIAASGVDEATSSKFLIELMRCHTVAMRQHLTVVASDPQPPPAAREHDNLDFTAPVIVNNPFGEGRIEVSDEDLDFTAIRPAALDMEDTPARAQGPMPIVPRPEHSGRTIRLPHVMVVGTWVSIEGADGPRAARLHYVSPLKSHFLFVDRRGDKVCECSRSVLARRLELGEVTLLECEPDASLFDRIMGSLLGKLRGPLAEAA